MTTLSQYFRAEVPDHTEPACFYAPGAESWHNTGQVRLGLFRRSSAAPEHLYPTNAEGETEH
jgi:hypothetical protein